MLTYRLLKIDETPLYYNNNQAAHLFTAEVLKSNDWKS